jgi:hypothetical protein
MYDLMLSEYPQEFISFTLKPSRSSHHSPETTYQSTAIIPYVEVALRHLNVSETGSMSGLFSRINKHPVEH